MSEKLKGTPNGIEPGDVEQWLKRVDRGEGVSPLHPDQGVSFATIYHFWKQNGGLSARGKSINSIDLLRNARTVKSVFPKIAGDMEISAEDCTNFLQIFFSHWKYAADRKTALPLFGKSQSEVSAFAELVSKKLLQNAKSLTAERQATQDFFIHEFFKARASDSNCIIIASLTSTIPGVVGEDTIGPFLGTVVRAVYETKNENFLIIFVVDSGIPANEPQTTEHRLRFLNIARLRTHLNAIQSFTMPSSEEKGLEAFARSQETLSPSQVWTRFKSRCCVFEGLSPHDDAKVLLTLEFSHEHILPTKVPEFWNNQDVSHKLFGQSSLGTEKGRFNLVTTIPRDGMDSTAPQFWAFPKSRNDRDPSHNYRVEELPSPGKTYETAADIVYRAACSHMKIPTTNETHGKAALNAVKAMGFEVRTANAFVTEPLQRKSA